MFWRSATLFAMLRTRSKRCWNLDKNHTFQSRETDTNNSGEKARVIRALLGAAVS